MNSTKLDWVVMETCPSCLYSWVIRGEGHIVLHFYPRRSRRVEVTQIMFISKHRKGSTLGQEEESAPDCLGSLPSSAFVEGVHPQACSLPTPAGLLDPLRE